MNIVKLLVIGIVGLSAVSVRADTWKDPATGYTWTYTVSGETATIYRNSYAETISPTPTGSLTIPTTLGGNQVTRIGDHAFYKCSGLTSMTILKSEARIDKGGIILGRLSVQGFSCGERLCASTHGSTSQPQKSVAVLPDVCGHILRWFQLMRNALAQMGGSPHVTE